MNGLYTAEGLEDKNVLWLKHHNIVRQEALQLHKRLPANVELDDLIQAGSMGFLSAVESFDPKKGVKLNVWIAQRVKWALLDELRERDWVPRRVRTDMREIVSVIQQIEQEQGREASEADIAQRMGVSLQEFQRMLADNNNSQIYSMDELQENFADSWENNGEENENLNPLHDTIRENLIGNIAVFIGMMPEREQRILQLYYQEDLNMKEIALILGVSETRVSQIHSLAIKRLRSRIDILND
ncbi:RNA polymerase sigma factor FliA [Citrobacter sp. wls619]|uniref:RNA polymerase sigma factor FliA n=1 Tax=Citrobacter sp. wls619 TaxID=2576432 RepID=UPI0010CA0E0A|nr:RNA polymerase sigma factor FliA [Citrobacter sp. wls619]TKV07880.1 RNA polymerase sigma factor FliA [Citrobacter sp. wls619]